MKKLGFLTLAAGSVAALLVGTALPSLAQDQGQGQRQGRRGGQGRGGFGGQFGRGGMMGGGFMNADPTSSSKLMLLQRDDVRSELGISAKQREQMEQARLEAHSLVTEAQATVAHETREARSRLLDSARALARLVAGKLIGREVRG
jgi:hypothetical protein